jgi:hypothetical protein
MVGWWVLQCTEFIPHHRAAGPVGFVSWVNHAPQWQQWLLGAEHSLPGCPVV